LGEGEKKHCPRSVHALLDRCVPLTAQLNHADGRKRMRAHLVSRWEHGNVWGFNSTILAPLSSVLSASFSATVILSFCQLLQSPPLVFVRANLRERIHWSRLQQRSLLISRARSRSLRTRTARLCCNSRSVLPIRDGSIRISRRDLASF